MPVSRSLVVAIGGAAGAGCRWALADAVGGSDWPWALLVINVVGSFLLGAVLVSGSGATRELVRLGLGVGFCGGFTTFSSFAVDTVHLLDDGRSAAAAAFTTLSVVLSALALVTGMRARHRPVRS